MLYEVITHNGDIGGHEIVGDTDNGNATSIGRDRAEEGKRVENDLCNEGESIDRVQIQNERVCEEGSQEEPRREPTHDLVAPNLKCKDTVTPEAQCLPRLRDRPHSTHDGSDFSRILLAWILQVRVKAENVVGRHRHITEPNAVNGA